MPGEKHAKEFYYYCLARRLTTIPLPPPTLSSKPGTSIPITPPLQFSVRLLTPSPTVPRRLFTTPTQECVLRKPVHGPQLLPPLTQPRTVHRCHHLRQLPSIHAVEKMRVQPYSAAALHSLRSAKFSPPHFKCKRVEAGEGNGGASSKSTVNLTIHVVTKDAVLRCGMAEAPPSKTPGAISAWVVSPHPPKINRPGLSGLTRQRHGRRTTSAITIDLRKMVPNRPQLSRKLESIRK